MVRFFENGYAGYIEESDFERALWLPEFRNKPRRPQLDNATLKEAESFYYSQRHYANRDEFGISVALDVEENFKRWLVADAPPINEGLYSVLIADAPIGYEAAKQPLIKFSRALHRDWTFQSQFTYAQFAGGLLDGVQTANMLIRAAAVGEPREFYSGVQLIDDRVAELTAAAPELIFSATHELERVKRNRLYQQIIDYAQAEHGERVVPAVQLHLEETLENRSISDTVDPAIEFEAFKKELPSLL